MTENNSNLTDEQITHIFETIKQVSIRYIGEKESNYTGLSEDVIAGMEETYGFAFPEVYRRFLAFFPGAHLKIFDGQTYGSIGVKEAQEVSKEILSEDNKVLPDGSFAFSQWQGYQFYYFIRSARSNNPETCFYMEGSEDPKGNSCGCFTDWLVHLSIHNVRLFGGLLNREVEEGIEILEKLLIERME